MPVQKPTRHVKRVHMETQPHAVRTTPPVSPIDTSLSKKPNQPERSCSTTAEKLESALASEASTVSASGRRQVRTCFVKHSSDSFLRLPIVCIYIWILARHGQILAVEQEIPPHDFPVCVERDTVSLIYLWQGTLLALNDYRCIQNTSYVSDHSAYFPQCCRMASNRGYYRTLNR